MKGAARLTGALRAKRLVGRTTELKIIRDAIWATGESRVLHIVGSGGIGKTRLLEEVPHLAFEYYRTTGQPCICSDILDFYFSSIHSRHGLESRLLNTLDPKGVGFAAYRTARREFDKLLASGSDPARIDEARQRLEDRFVDGFNQISAVSRVILVLDTVEQIQYESDLIQEICGLYELTGLEVKDWLLDNVPRLQNTVVILAGREKPELAAGFEQRFAQHLLPPIVLGPLSEDETLDYFAAVAEVQPAFRKMGLTADQQRVIHRYTAGLPIKLAFVVDLLTRDVHMPEELYTPLETVRAQSEYDLAVARKKVEAALVTDIMRSTRDVDMVLPYIALARKGMNRELLARITGWLSEQCSQVLQDLRRFSFVKVRPRSGTLFLHDEMYDLLEKHAWDRMEAEREQICQTILAYYEELLQQSRSPRRVQELTLDRLYYQFLAHPKDGYAEYARQSDAALFDYDVEFDMRLRDEMLQFCVRYPVRVRRYGLTTTYIEYDAAVHWVKRYVRTGKYHKAIGVAQAVEQHPRLQPGNTPSFALAQGELDAYHAIALIYTGKIESGITKAKTLIANLEGLSEPDDLAYYGERGSFDVWRRNLVLGLAHNNLGYAYWMDKGYYRAALKEFRSAPVYFHAAKLEEQTANVSDNIGRVYALLGDRARAETLVNNGLDLRRRLGYEYRIGLSLISRAILHLQFGEPHRACRVGEQALAVFEELDAQRGIGLACITLGQALRQLGALWRAGIYSQRECQVFLRDSINQLGRAADIFPRVVDEPIRLIEAFNELGCAWRERVGLLRSIDSGSTAIPEAQEQAFKYLVESVRLAEANPVLYADSCEDLAQAHFQDANLAEAEAWLDRAEEAIPAVYKLQPGRGLAEIAAEESVEDFWRQMGKIEALRGHLAFACGQRDEKDVLHPDLDEALRHYVPAAAYLERYPGWAAGRQATLKEIYGRFSRCGRDDLRRAWNHTLPALASAYALDVSMLYRFFEDTLGLALSLAS